ncbi:enoyl-CoA hydratase/isomerase family protein [Halocatena salina]|uniref:Enoyl-CoA hydratase/isomerase family protein n=1 Tax=Halocatena salina TaxID=2934340 RepID=A0A8U0A679_9EURY|nr:enoyl-CoA hydratase/isomerase family protein [Halocatena salina]UPM43427.1 enoyl-CoA hydratase/isomerase family protein [Halocatena salina]
MAYDTIDMDHAAGDRIAIVRLDAPSRNNVLDMQMIQEFTLAVTEADRDDDVEGIVVSATGEMFCAGADLNYLKELSFEEGTRFMTAYFEALDLLRDTGKPAVAGVQGICAAGGNELVSACDLVVADETARFTQPEAGVGATAAGGGVQLLPLIVGEKRAKDLLLTGRMIEAEEARAMGLINRVVPENDAETRAVDLTETIVDHTSPQAYRTIKAIMKPWTNFGLLGQEMARDLTARVWDSEEFRERAAAFLADEELDPRGFDGVRPPRSEE